VSLKIRAEQIEAFQPVADAGFARRLADYLRSAHPDAVVRISSGSVPVSRIPNAVLNRMVQNGIARARSYELSWESSLASFVIIMFVAAPNFDEHPLIQVILRDEGVAADHRIEGLWRRISNQNWKAVEAYYDPRAWGLGDQSG
jgi:hypothetical protein